MGTVYVSINSLYRNGNIQGITDKAGEGKLLIGLIIIILMWGGFLFHPVIISIIKGNPIWLFLYALFPIEAIIVSLLTSIIIKITEQ